jgi:hypothetical protein
MSRENVEKLCWMRRKLTDPFICVVVGAALLASLPVGCGGSDTTSVATSNGQRLSQQEFVAQANAICKQANNRATALPRPSSRATLVSFFEQLEAITDPMVARLAALTPPSDANVRFNRMLNELRQGFPLVDKTKAAARAGDAQRLRSIAQRFKALNHTINSDARAIGLSECAKNPSSQG